MGGRFTPKTLCCHSCGCLAVITWRLAGSFTNGPSWGCWRFARVVNERTVILWRFHITVSFAVTLCGCLGFAASSTNGPSSRSAASIASVETIPASICGASQWRQKDVTTMRHRRSIAPCDLARGPPTATGQPCHRGDVWTRVERHQQQQQKEERRERKEAGDRSPEQTNPRARVFL